MNQNQINLSKFSLGLDDSILPYVQFFVNNQINGCRLLLLTAQDLVNLNITKVGHQEIILEAVELLRNLHYNLASETLQTISLRLACRSRALFNQLKKSAAEKQYQLEQQKLLEQQQQIQQNIEAESGKHHHSFVDHFHHLTHNPNKKEKKNSRKELASNLLNKSFKHSIQQKPAQPPNQQIKKEIAGENDQMEDLSPLSTDTLSSVVDLLSAVRDYISWVDRYPFDGNSKHMQTRKTVLQISIELASTAQRDQFVQGPNEIIKNGCKKLADICDRQVQEMHDSLAMQTVTLDVVTVSKNFDEDLGMHIHSSYSGMFIMGIA